MGIRRPGAKGYEEVEGVNIPTNPPHHNGNGTGIINNVLAAPEFELASVSVVPDGIFLPIPKTFRHHLLIVLTFCRHIHSCAGGQRFGFWMVPSETVAVRWTLLDE